MDSVTLADVQQAAATLRGVVHVTPVLTSRQLNERSGAHVFAKCENFQRVGAFKSRGAYNAIASLPPAQRNRPIVTLSSGNHAQGVALACRLLGREAHIVMPAPINPLKRSAVEGYGATVHEAAGRREADHVLEEVLARHNGVYIHAFNDPTVIAGQGTVMLELLGAVPDLEVVLAPIGGGGLLSGLCVAAHGLKPAMQMYACEPSGALDAMISVRENRIVPMPSPQTMAEGLMTSLGDITLPILRRHLAGFFVVEEQEIVQAMRFAFERLKIVIEPSSAVALVPLLRHEEVLAGKKVGVVLTGGNVDLGALPFK
jgi:threonine dehydratase